MEFGRSFLRLTIIFAGTLVFLGCHSKSEQNQSTTAERESTADSGEPAAIGPAPFAVGEEVRLAFSDLHARAAEAFVAGADGRWMADPYNDRRRINGYGEPNSVLIVPRDGTT